MTLMASEIADYLGEELVGRDCEVNCPRPITEAEPGAICFDPGGLYFYSENGRSEIACRNPRLAFARVLQKYFARSPVSTASSAVVHSWARIGKGCRIKSNAVIGEEGFGFERDENGVPVRVPHLGGVLIGNDVEVGACTVIARGTLSDTVIEDHVKLDDQVFIAHNVRIGQSTLVVAGAVICGSATIGERCWIGATSCIKEGVTVGDDSIIGMGAVVLHDVGPREIIVGNPARFLRWNE